MLGRAAERFIRTKWGSVQELAEEMYAVFSPDAPIQTSQIIINQAAASEAPPFVINRQPGSTGPSVQINNNGGTNNFGPIDYNGSTYGPSNFNFNENPGDINFGPGNSYGPLNFNGTTFNLGDFSSDPGGGQIRPGSGGIDIGTLNIPGQDQSTRLLAIPSPTYNPFVLYGEVQAKSSGNVYAVKVWAKSPAGGAPAVGIFNARFPMVDASELIPAGTPCPVLCFPGLDPTNVATILDAIGFVPTFF